MIGLSIQWGKYDLSNHWIKSSQNNVIWLVKMQSNIKYKDWNFM